MYSSIFPHNLRSVICIKLVVVPLTLSIISLYSSPLNHRKNVFHLNGLSKVLKEKVIQREF